MDLPVYIVTSSIAARALRRLCGIMLTVLVSSTVYAQDAILLNNDISNETSANSDLRVVALEKMLAQTRKNLETHQAQLQQRDAEIDALRQAIGDRDMMLDEYDESAAGEEALNAKLEDLLHQNDVLRNEIITLHASIEKQRAVMDAREAELSALKQSLQDRDELLAESDTQIDELVEKTSELTTIEHSKGVLENRLQRQTAETADLNDELQACRQKQNDLLSQISNLQIDKKESEQMIARQKSQLSELTDALANHDMLLKVVGQSEVTLADKDHQLTQLTSQLADTKKQLEQEQLEQIKQNDLFESERTNLTSTIDGYREQLAALQQEQQQKQTLIDEMTELNAQDQDTMQAMQSELQELKDQKDALLANLVQREDALNKLQNDVQEQEDLLTAEQEKNKALQIEFEAIEKDMSERNKSYAQLKKEYEALTVTVRARENEARSLKQQKQSLARVSEDNRVLRKKVNSLEDGIKNYKRELAKATGEITRTQQELQQLKRLRLHGQSEREALEEEIARLQNAPVSTKAISSDETSFSAIDSWPTESSDSSLRPVPTGIPLGEQVADANRALRLGRITEAERIFHSVLRIDARQPGALLGLASCYYANQDYPEAYKITQQLIDEDALDGHALALQGLIEYKQGDLTAAAAVMEKAIMLRPEDAKLHNYMGMIFYARKQYKRAARSFQESIDLNPSSSDAHRNLALVTITASPDDKEFAQRHYEQALNLGAKSDAKLEALIYDE